MLETLHANPVRFLMNISVNKSIEDVLTTHLMDVVTEHTILLIEQCVNITS